MNSYIFRPCYHKVRGFFVCGISVRIKFSNIADGNNLALLFVNFKCAFDVLMLHSRDLLVIITIPRSRLNYRTLKG